MTDAINLRIPHDWQPRDYQRPLWEYLEAGGKRACVAWHRRSGKDSTAINWEATAAMQRVGLYFHMAPELAHVRKIIWNAIDSQGRRVIDQAFPPALRESSHDNEMRIRLRNGSVWQCVGSDSYDSLVGTNPVGLVFSEFALADPKAWDLLRPILAENGGWALFISTEGWFAQLLTVDDTQAIDAMTLAQERAEMSKSLFQQEYYCSFVGAVEGAYYAEHFERAANEGRVTR